MSRSVTDCTEDAGLEEVYDLIRKCEHGLVVVVDSHAHRVPIGIVTERSICEQIILRGRNPRSLFAGAVMDSRIRKVLETDLVEAIAQPENDEMPAVIVTNSRRQVTGLVPRAALASRSVALSQAAVAGKENAETRTRPRISEIPAFGWVQ